MTYRFVGKAECRICGSRDRSFIGRRSPRTLILPESLIVDVYQCRRCRLVYPDPMPTPDAGQTIENYSDPESYFPIPIDAERLSFYGDVLRRLESLIGAKPRLLDVGSGRGELLHVAQMAGWSVLGVEPSRVFAAHSRKQFGVPVLEGYLGALPLPAERYDAVTMLSVLEMTDDPVCLLGAALRWLRPGGVVYLETTNQAGLVYRLGDAYYRLRGQHRTSRLSPTFPSYQLLGYTPQTLRRLFERLNCGVISSEARANRGLADKLKRGGAGDRALGTGLELVNALSRLSGTGAILTTIARPR